MYVVINNNNIDLQIDFQILSSAKFKNPKIFLKYTWKSISFAIGNNFDKILLKLL